MAKGEQMTEQQEAKGAPRGPGSFKIPRAAFNALLDAKATAYEICAYLVLAKHTEATGRYSTASITAVNTATGANKTKGGPIDRAIERLKTIRVKKTITVQETHTSYGKRSSQNKEVTRNVQKDEDLGPILFDRATWLEQTGETLPDGPHERAKVLFVLPDFGEPIEDRIWFGNNLVSGVGGFNQPLKRVKDAGSEAARLLLAMYAANDMETWGGVRPVGHEFGPCKRYEPVAEDVPLHGGARLIRAKDQGLIGPGGMFSRAWPWDAPKTTNVYDTKKTWWEAHTEAGGPVWRALEALESAGLVYEVVMVLNRSATKAKFSSGTEYGSIPDDAEPYYELDARSQHGYKPVGEEGIGSATATTAGDLGHPVAVAGGRFNGTYAAIVRRGQGAMIAGVYRLRFRVANKKNAGVTGAWARIHQNNRENFDLVQSIRAANKLPALTPPASLSRATNAPAMPEGDDLPDGQAADKVPF